MAPRLRLTPRCIGLLLVLAAAALPVYGSTVARGSTAAHDSPVTHDSSVTHGSTAAHTSRVTHAGPVAHGASPAHAPEPEPGHPGHDRPDQGPSAFADPAQRDSPPGLPMPSDSASASVRPYASVAVAEPSRAGSRAGEGRMRPGRPDGPAAEVEGDDDPVPATVQPQEPETAETPAASQPPAEAGLDPAQPPAQPADQQGAQQAAQQDETATEPVLRILPLGSGLVLIGLGLGLALLGLRLRKN
ncbi:hypothetical protein JK359_14510 [Streptomyces actinomycinicus]|uniref:Gram-positive cocci surface proteins LPxTG domain-containing protein n=1 Tax=Streptomyces actinomycinicus TaxID=1695166 RepID=A0A937JM60_9ACTN|nr:hypothetical protein [Streptomyces actinomycinicus]MBL1083185.1 hypothetical protein [Streptomyces actinomycinicus]